MYIHVVCAVSRLQEEVELMEDEMRRREGGTDVETDGEMERALYVGLCVYSEIHDLQLNVFAACKLTMVH